MVLQQGKPVGIWGKGEEGAPCQSLAQRAGWKPSQNGEWSITFDPYEAGGPFELTIQIREKTRIIKDILIGEVWIVGGRSDMQWSSNGSIHRKQELSSRPTVASGCSNKPDARPRRSQFDTLPAKWTSSTSENPVHWNAVAQRFAADLQRRPGVRRSAHQLRRRDPANALDFIETFRRPRVSILPCKALYRPSALSNHAESSTNRNSPTSWTKEKREQGLAPTYYGRVPSGYYNAMIHPIRKFSTRGVIWYQGEENALTTKDAFEYARSSPS